MIGWVEFINGGVTVQAILDASGKWTWDAVPPVFDLLNRACPPVGEPADDAWGHSALIKAAQRIGGIAWLGPGRLAD